ncbi:dihydroxy-acid dehydratase [Megasphaera paucivorans]|uniref:Dihydroxy-acid dehydratase n=1 Tax=Megasphaera paucivorans TaxID=349095 RepID=A0A1H0AKG3_9FIRM|nr:dihydroxy-acid dehydratase [Megasphaera paucivorans]SDN33316.1 dihydroxy-acid dehydratase [Megasphaera paucivorans]
MIEQKSKQTRKIWPQVDALKLAMNWSEKDLDKLQILVDDVQGESHPGSYHLDTLSKESCVGVFESGGRPAKFHVTDICDGWAEGHDGMNYILPSREVIANMVEIHGNVIPWDGLILLSGCDKAVPAHLIAAARLDLPTVHIPSGSQHSGPNLTTAGLCGRLTAKDKRGEATAAEMRNYKLTGCPTCGVCQFMGTASTMQCMSEALGLALPGTALMPAMFGEIKHYARAAGLAVMNLAEKGITASKILTKEAFINAIKVHAALGGSTNAFIHLPAVAHELGITIEPDIFDEINRKVKHLVNVQPNGKYVGELFWMAGGVPMVEWLIRDCLDLDVMTCTGKTLGENLEQLWEDDYFVRCQGHLQTFGINPEDVITPPEKATMYGSVAVMRGNIAPDGSVIKYSATVSSMQHHIGKAAVFDSEEAAYDAVIKRHIQPDTVVVIRYEGPKGSGMPEMHMTTDAIIYDDTLNKSVAVVTDGRFSGASSGPCIGHVSPEAVEGGPIALIENDDLIEIDIPNRALNIVGVAGVHKTPDEISEIMINRKKNWKLPTLKPKKGILKIYTKLAVSGMAGAYMDID